MSEDKILIVEDDAILAIHLEDVLKRQGYSVLPPVAKGEDAINVVKDLQPGLILMDIELGGKINGITAAEMIGEMDDVPVIFLTGFSHDPLLQQAKITAPYGYLVKPVPERELAATIEMAIYKHSVDHKVRESESRYRSLVEQASDGIFMTDQQENIIEVNDAECDLLGYSREELLKLNMENLIYEGDRAEVPFRVNEMLDGKTARSETRMRRKDGAILFVEISGKLLENGKIQGIIRDITQRKITENALRKSEEKFSKAFHTSPDSININRLSDGLYLEINSGFTDLSGYTWDDVRGKTSLEISIWENPDDRTRLIQGLREKGEVSNLDASFRIKNGTIKECLMSAKTIEIDGEMCILSITRDITERKRAEKAIKESEEKFRSVFENSAIGISITDLNSNFIAGNPAILKMLGYSLEEYCRLNIRDISHPDDEKKDMDHMREVTEGRLTSFSMVKRNLHKDGHIVWGQLTNSVVLDSAGHPKYTIGMLEDITDRKQTEDSLHEQEKLIRTVFDTVPVGIFIVNKEGKITLLNPAGQNIWEGVRYSELDELGEYKGWWRSTGKLLSAHEWGSARAVENGETSMNEEIEIECFNGVHKIISNSAVPIFDDQNIINGAVAVIQDITDRTKAAEALQRRNEYLAAMQVTIYELISQLDLDLLLENLTVRAGQMMHTTACFLDLIDPLAGKLIPQVGKGIMSDSLNHAVQPGEGVAGVVWQTRKPYVVNDYDHWNGRVNGFQNTGVNSLIGVPLLSGDEILGVLGLAYDYDSGRVFDPEEVEILSQFARLATIAIQNARLYTKVQEELAERKIAEAALRESEERFHQMFEGHNATMLLISPDTAKIIDANPAACRYYGYTLDELRGKPISDLNLAPAVDQANAIQSVLDQTRVNLIFPHKLASGEVRTVEVHSTPIEVNNQKILFSIVHDITERKLAEEQVQKQLDELRRWNEVTLGRETRVIELKHEVNELLKKAGEPQRYNFIQEPINE